ncbi:MAG: ATP-grasp domain-containing protein, partial [Candidatus Pacebacteria bacterium]|nr:ATP-grasp domain-containing protein [Candidatus Paceibacterota bacterium]
MSTKINSKKKVFKKDIVLFVGPVPNKSIEEWKAKEKPKYLLYNLQSKKQKKSEIEKSEIVFDKVIKCSFSHGNSIADAIKDFRQDIVAVTARGESKLWYLRRLIPHVPYVKTPTESSILWSTDKIKMRKRLKEYAGSITPKFTIVHNTSKQIIDKVEKEIGYPMMIKPSGLAASMLVTNCYHRDELELALARVYKQANIFHKIYKEFYHENTPQVLVEELMEGEMYSIDGVVNGKGKVTCYPPVHVKTGKQIGFDDYFGYQRLLPSRLNENNTEEAESTTKKAVHALGLRYSPFHIELLKTEDGWKVIEIGPRIGGFRQTMYKLSYGIDSTTNDILTRMGKKPKVLKTLKGHTSVLNIFA